VQEKAVEIRDQAGTQIREQVDRQSTTAGHQVQAIGEALRRSSTQLRSEGKQAPASVLEQVAGRAESLGEYLERADGNRILGDVESFARRRPWLTGVAGLTAGFLASRFLKASSDRRYETTGVTPPRGVSARPAAAVPAQRELVSGGAR
jgi:hypothetical protein